MAIQDRESAEIASGRPRAPEIIVRTIADELLTHALLGPVDGSEREDLEIARRMRARRGRA